MRRRRNIVFGFKPSLGNDVLNIQYRCLVYETGFHLLPNNDEFKYFDTAIPAYTMSEMPTRYSYLQRKIYVNSSILLAFMDGLYTALVIFAVYILASGRRQRVEPHKYLLSAAVVMYFCAMVHLANRWQNVVLAFLEETPEQALTVVLGGSTYLTVMGTMSATLTFAADSIMIWRCWIIWGRSRKVFLLLITSHTLSTAFAIIVRVVQTSDEGQIEDTPAYRLVVRSGVIYLTTSLATTLLATLLIISRLVLLGRVPGLSTHWSSVEILVESAALYSIVLIVYLVFWLRTDEATMGSWYDYAQCIMVPMSGIAPTLIITRVLFGKVQNDAWKHPVNLSALRFRRTPTDQSSYETTTVGSKEMVSELPEGHAARRVSHREEDEVVV